MDNTNELGDLWLCWSHGQQLDLTFQLWNVQLLWWNRIGMLIQFVGALMILAEIVGVDRIKSIADNRRAELDEITRKGSQVSLWGAPGDVMLHPLKLATLYTSSALWFVMTFWMTEKLFKVMSVLFVAFGFHFNLLAS